MKRLTLLVCLLANPLLAWGGFPGSPISGGGSGTATAITDNLIMDADVNSAAGIAATKIAAGTIDNTEFGYLNGLNQNLATTDNVTFNKVTSGSFVSSAADNTHLINVGNTSDPATLADGDCWYDKTSETWDCSDGSVVSAVGSKIDSFSFVVKGATGADNTLLMKAPRKMTLTQLDCIIDPGDADGTDNVTTTLLECDAAGDSCVSGGGSVIATNAGASDTTFTDADIDANDWIKVTFDTVQGTASFLSCTTRFRWSQ